MAPDMDWLTQVMAVVGFFALRLVVPALVIAAVAWFLHKLDRRWQAEADLQRRAALDVAPAFVPSPDATKKCWEQRDCPPERREQCVAYAQPSVSCWLSRQAHDGALPTACLSCGIYRTRLLPQAAPVSAPTEIPGATPAA